MERRRRSQRDRPEAHRDQKVLRTKSRRAAGGAGQGTGAWTTVMQVLEVKPHPPCDLVTPLLGVYIPET